ncbi:MAG: glutamate 5-kinase [Candidatus Sumerlaeaceae bacterium]|nr:glutamate 5-kinase [Candidatus Sumerlaeaceae bacterium]
MSPVLNPSPFGKARTLVVKLGSAVLTDAAGNLDHRVIRDVVDSVARLIKHGRHVILVSSGAVAAGRGALGLTSGKLSISEKQAMAAVGQTRLMQIYADVFARHDIVVGQMLLSRADIEDRRRYVNARYTLQELLRRQCVPIINENDTVTVDELRFGDNDGLAALVAVKMQADALVLLSDVDGLFDSNPRQNRDACLMETVDKLTPGLIDEWTSASDGSAFGTGGMRSKLLAARVAVTQGVCVAIANGKVTGQLDRMLSGDFRGTYFPTNSRRDTGYRQWLLSKRNTGGRRVVVDDGARKALIEKKKSLLPAGVRELQGRFEAGDVVEIVDTTGVVIGRGVVNFSSTELGMIIGHKSSDIARILGSKTYDEAIHRDHLVLDER